jgi:hypothetical protein
LQGDLQNLMAFGEQVQGPQMTNDRKMKSG